ncbi:MAG: hypothetical protein SH868_20525, partial [Bythopirellula sp.]|nr:hypothetical protein [Bythopirellula sp.]
SRWHVERTNRCFYKVWRKSRAIVREVIWEIRGKGTGSVHQLALAAIFACKRRPCSLGKV